MTKTPPPIAHPLDRRWIKVLDQVGPRLLGRDDRQGADLAREVAALSQLYTRDRQDLKAAGRALAPRLRFFLPRDLPKIQGPLAELAAASALPDGEFWTVLDLGAGLGTTSLGLAEFAKRVPGLQALDVHALERDVASLDAFRTVARAAQEADLIAPMTLTTERARLDKRPKLPMSDIILMGLTLNELHPELAPEARLDAKEALLRKIATRLSPGGSLIVLEPGTRACSRDLQTLRDRLVAEESPAKLFAPCPHLRPCPLLERPRDWCHDKLPFALPEPLPKVARAAGLRFEGLTYSYLTLRRPREGEEPMALGERLGAKEGEHVYRVVGGPVRSKGKMEWEGCGGACPEGSKKSASDRIMRIDRERSEHNEGIEGAERGSLLAIEGEGKEGRLRLRPDVSVRRLLR